MARTSNSVGRAFGMALASGVLASAALIESAQDGSGALPPRIESYLSTAVRPTPAERRLLTNGGPVTKLLDADAGKEVAVFGAVWIGAPIRRYVEAMNDIEKFERGRRIGVTRRISTPPRLEDFAQLHLPEEDVRDLRSCRVGDCELKLDHKALETFRTEVDWNAPDTQAAAERVMRRLALEYVTGYLEEGNERLAVYRDNSRPTFVAEEFRSIVEEMPSLTADMPNVRGYLLGYPRAQLPGATSFLYWQETRFGLKPTIRISHLVVREGADDTVVASKMLYASHYFWTALELRVLVPDPARGPGFWFVTINRGRSDGLSGFLGLFVRRRVRSEVAQGALAALTLTKNLLERTR